jgi:hypothetical protein
MWQTLQNIVFVYAYTHTYMHTYIFLLLYLGTQRTLHKTHIYPIHVTCMHAYTHLTHHHICSWFPRSSPSAGIGIRTDDLPSRRSSRLCQSLLASPLHLSGPFAPNSYYVDTLMTVTVIYTWVYNHLNKYFYMLMAITVIYTWVYNHLNTYFDMLMTVTVIYTWVYNHLNTYFWYVNDCNRHI